ncbi:hypothetical protein ABH908_000074 [Pseudomonas frederiksbergensis]
MSGFNKTFTGDAPFQAMHACSDWLEERGYSRGSTCVLHPTGVLFGDWDIAKWKNLTKREIAALDGHITGDTRNGPVTLHLKKAPADHAE